MSDYNRIAMLAAWCDADSHFTVPCSRSAQRICETLASSGWRPSLSITENLRSEIEAVLRGQDNNSQLRTITDLTTAEISQRSVDILLREYYQMMQDQQRTAQPTAGGSSSSLQRVFLLICPPLPAYLDLQHVLRAAVCITQFLAKWLVLLSCLLVPLWLMLLRELLQQQQQHQAVAAVFAGLAVLLASDFMYRSREAARRAAATNMVTADSVGRLQATAGSQCAGFMALQQASKTATPANSSKHNQAQQQLRPLQLQQQAEVDGAEVAGAVTTAPAAVPWSGPSYLELLPALAALQSAVGIPGTAGSVNSRERLAEELVRLCTMMGLPCSQDMTASPAAMAATIGQLKSSIGI